MRTLEQIMESIEASIQLRAKTRYNNRLRDELLARQQFERQQIILCQADSREFKTDQDWINALNVYEAAFEQLDHIDLFYAERNRAPH